MFGYVYCDGCGAGFDAYEYRLPNGLCDRCEERREMEPQVSETSEHDPVNCVRPASGDMCPECERFDKEAYEATESDDRGIACPGEYDLSAASLYFGRLLA